jgi:hypothetical protein
MPWPDRGPGSERIGDLAAVIGQAAVLEIDVPKTFNSLGCSPMFREAAAVGFRLTERWSVTGR